MKYKKALIFGTYDPLHYAHIRLFERASKLAREVYACTESDEIIRKNKKRDPFTTEIERVKDLRGIKYLKNVFIRTEKINRDFYVKMLKPDVLILGSDWKGKKWEGEGLGVKIIYLPRTEGISSTDIRNGLGISKIKTIQSKIQDCCKAVRGFIG